MSLLSKIFHNHIWVRWMEDYDGSTGVMCLKCKKTNGVTPLTDSEIKSLFGSSRKELISSGPTTK